MAGIEAVCFQVGADVGDQVALAKLLAGEIDRHAAVREPLVAPGAQLAAGGGQHPFADGDDQPGMLGHRDEVPGRHQARGRVVPAHQRLEAADGPGGAGDFGLVVEHELIVLHRPVQLAFDLQVAEGAGVDAVGIEGVGVGAERAAGVASGRGGVLVQFFRGLAVVRAHRDAHVQGHPDLVVAHLEPLGKGREDAPDDPGDAVHILDVDEQDAELVLAEAGDRGRGFRGGEVGDGVRGAQGLFQSLDDLREQSIARLVAQGFPDPVDRVVGHGQHRHHALLPRQPVQGVGQPVVEDRPGRQAGGAVVHLEVFQFLQPFFRQRLGVAQPAQQLPDLGSVVGSLLAGGNGGERVARVVRDRGGLGRGDRGRLGAALVTPADHPVAAAFLGEVQGLVRLAGEFLDPLGLELQGTEAKTHGDADAGGIVGLDDLAHPVGDDCRPVEADVRQDNAEFLAAVPADQVHLAEILAQQSRDHADHPVAGGVAVAVVDQFEMVDVAHDAGQLAAVALGHGEQPLELAVEGPPVEQQGERVVAGEEFQLAVFRLHLFGGQVELADRPVEFLVAPFQFGDVVEGGEYAAAVALAVHHRHRVDGQGDVAQLTLPDGQARAGHRVRAAEHLHPRQLRPVVVPLPGQFRPLHPDQLGRPAARQPGEAAVGEHDLLPLVEDEHALLEGVKGGPHPLGDHRGGIEFAQGPLEQEKEAGKTGAENEQHQAQVRVPQAGRETAALRIDEAEFHRGPAFVTAEHRQLHVGQGRAAFGRRLPVGQVIAGLDEQFAGGIAQRGRADIVLPADDGLQGVLDQPDLVALGRGRELDGQHLGQVLARGPDLLAAIRGETEHLGKEQQAGGEQDQAEGDAGDRGDDHQGCSRSVNRFSICSSGVDSGADGSSGFLPGFFFFGETRMARGSMFLQMGTVASRLDRSEPARSR